ncbi:MAG TPA: DUF1489 domain-containing protein [Thermohalobaculum sp.]|nr:DUF1489 domain-containing protein [Thermohalobaculum sp.]
MLDAQKTTLHLVKLSVGTISVEDQLEWQSQRSAERLAAGLDPRPRHVTRMWPKRAGELLNGGSLYWVIRGIIRVRQRIAALDEVIGEDGIRRCAIVFEPPLIPTAPRPRRAFQGWRYLNEADAPPDIGTAPGDEPDLPPGMREALTRFGVLRG